MDEPQMTPANAADILGLPKRETPEPASPEVEAAGIQPADEPEDLQRDAERVVIDREALRAAEQRDANLWAAGVPPARSAAQKRRDDQAFIERIHRPADDVA